MGDGEDYTTGMAGAPMVRICEAVALVAGNLAARDGRREGETLGLGTTGRLKCGG
jgi:hypothetical protein